MIERTRRSYLECHSLLTKKVRNITIRSKYQLSSRLCINLRFIAIIMINQFISPVLVSQSHPWYQSEVSRSVKSSLAEMLRNADKHPLSQPD
jgi:hypothetical protein